MKKNISPLYKKRRELLCSLLTQHYEQKWGAVFLYASYETARTLFRQSTNFYYYSGITEPGTVLMIEPSGYTRLFIPQYGQSRAQWVAGSLQADTETAIACGVDEVVYLGDVVHSYSLSPSVPSHCYTALAKAWKETQTDGKQCVIVVPQDAQEYCEFLLLLTYSGGSLATVLNAAPLVAQQRRCKSKEEIELLYKSIDVTLEAHVTAAQMIVAQKTEREIQASIEYVVATFGGRPAFPTIVATGKNSTILHYNESSHTLKDGELVVIDCGAELDYYCGDITRTYPVSGEFTTRQRQVYEIVLATQEYIAQKAAPGIWLHNAEKPDQSLHHLAVAFLAERGYDKYFVHGIGHFLGMDVHDVGDRSIPLQEGDVITIEPGIYIPEENIGIRIEDNYWIVKDGAICLSDSLPKDPEALEKMLQADDEDSDFEQEHQDSFEDDELFDLNQFN